MAINRDKIRVAAQKYLQKGQLDKAIKEFQRLVEDDPKDVRTLLKLGDLQTRAGDAHNATQTYLQVAQFYSEQGFFLKAVAVYKQILKIDPSIIEVNNRLAELYQQLGLLSDASGQFRQLALLLEQQGHIAECVSVLHKMLELDPENIATRVKLAEMYAKQNKLEDAKREFRESAMALKRQQRIEDYVKVAERMVFFCPDDLPTTRELANLYIQQGDARRALAKLQVCFKHDPRDVETLALLASAFTQLEQIPKAVSVYRELGRLCRESGQPREYLAAMRKVIELVPDDAEAQGALAEASGPSTSVPGATAPARTRDVGTTPAAASPGPAAPEIEAGLTLEATAAIVTATEAAAPQDAAGKLLVEADIYVKYGLRDKALEHVRKVLSIDPKNREAQEKHKVLLLEAGDTPSAIAQLWEMAQAAYRAGDLERAGEDLAELLAIDPTHTPALELSQNLDPARTAAAAPELPEPELDDIDVALTDGEEIASVALAGTAADLSLTYEPSPEAAEIDLDTDDELAPPVPLQAASDSPAGGDVPTVASGVPSTPAPRSGSRVPARPASPPARGATPSSTRSKAGTSPSSTVATGFEDLDAFLASAVPSRKTAAPASTKPVATSSAEVSPEQLSDPAATYGARTDDLASAPIPSAELHGEEVRAISEEIAIELPAMPISPEAGPTAASIAGDEGLRPPGVEAVTAEPEAAEPEAAEPEAAEPEAAEPEPAEPEPAEPEAAKPEPAEPEAAGPTERESAPKDELAVQTFGSIEGDEHEVQIEHIDLAEELETDFAAASESEDSVAFTDVFEEFKKGVAEQVEESDHETHYDLGIAYKEMGLFDDAIREFAIARRAPEREIVALTMIGLCHLERGDIPAALEHFQLGLRCERITAAEAVALRYEIGRAYEEMGRLGDALRFYEKAHAMDAGFRDLAERLRQARELGTDAPAGHELDELLDDQGETSTTSSSQGRKISYL